MKYSLKFILLIVFCLSMFPLNAFAAGVEGNISLLADIEDKPEYSDAISYEADLLRQMNALTEQTKRVSLPTSVNFMNAVKVSTLDNSDSIESVRTKRNGTTYYYRIPLAIDTGYIYSTLVITDGKVTGYDTAMTYDTSLGQVSYLFDADLVNNLITKQTQTASDVTVYTIPSIKTDFVYFVDGDKAYSIPFASRPDFLGLDNGQIYEYEKFSSCVNALIKEMSADDRTFTGDQGGGGGMANSPYGTSLYVTLAIMLFAIVAISCILIVKQRINKTNR